MITQYVHCTGACLHTCHTPHKHMWKWQKNKLRWRTRERYLVSSDLCMKMHICEHVSPPCSHTRTQYTHTKKVTEDCNDTITKHSTLDMGFLSAALRYCTGFLFMKLTVMPVQGRNKNNDNWRQLMTVRLKREEWMRKDAEKTWWLIL